MLALGLFLLCLVVYHSSEYLLQLHFNPHDVNLRSFLFSREYVLAMCCAVVEYLLESVLTPGLKAAVWPIQILGFLMVVGGECVRKAAIITAGPSFTHDIKTQRRKCHVLVTRGVYRFMRHPAYAGWFIWSVGTQMLLGNPFCTVAFAFVSWKFFDARIPFEEVYLQQFFGIDYARYQLKVPSGIPLIP